MVSRITLSSGAATPASTKASRVQATIVAIESMRVPSQSKMRSSKGRAEVIGPRS
jgi:hypothetical protein